VVCVCVMKSGMLQYLIENSSSRFKKNNIIDYVCILKVFCHSENLAMIFYFKSKRNNNRLTLVYCMLRLYCLFNNNSACKTRIHHRRRRFTSIYHVDFDKTMGFH